MPLTLLTREQHRMRLLYLATRVPIRPLYGNTALGIPPYNPERPMAGVYEG